MKSNTDEHFWPSYVDLMTSIFFVMLVLFIVSYVLLVNKLKETEHLKRLAEIKASELDLIKGVKSTVESLLEDTTFFVYEKKYNRYRLAQNIEFEKNEYEINELNVKNFSEVKKQLTETGKRVRLTLDSLLYKKKFDPQYRNISYVMIITGRASEEGLEDVNYHLSYNRAYSLYQFWKSNVTDFDNPLTYRAIVDFQIAGVGSGGIGRFPASEDSKNRGFIIQIIPKIGQVITQLNGSKKSRDSLKLNH